ncbi:MAG: TadE family type IV pilus minor pilin [Candidatus Nanopelagicales bacterium]
MRGSALGWSPRRRRREDGMVTAETAVVLPVLVMLLVVLLGVIGHAVDQVRAIDAARTAARMAARGELVDDVKQQAAREAPPGSVVSVEHIDETFRVTLTVPGVRVLGLIELPQVEAVAVALDESMLSSPLVTP